MVMVGMHLPQRLRQIEPYIMVTRPPLVVLSIVASIALMAYYHTYEPFTKALLILISIVTANTAFNIANEISDIEIDSIGKVYKPLVRYPNIVKNVFVMHCALLLIGVFAVIYLFLVYDTIYIILASIALVCSIVYNIYNYRGIGGNIALGTTYGVAAYFCSYPHGLIFAIAFSILTIAFNITTQLQDIDDDRDSGRTTLPIQIGIRNARVLSLVLIGFFVIDIILSDISPIASMVFILSSLMLIFSEPQNFLYTEIFARVFGRIFMLLGFVFIFFGW